MGAEQATGLVLDHMLGTGMDQAMGMGMEQVTGIEKADTTTGTGPGAKNNRNICGLGLAQAVGEWSGTSEQEKQPGIVTGNQTWTGTGNWSLGLSLPLLLVASSVPVLIPFPCRLPILFPFHRLLRSHSHSCCLIHSFLFRMHVLFLFRSSVTFPFCSRSCCLFRSGSWILCHCRCYCCHHHHSPIHSCSK